MTNTTPLNEEDRLGEQLLLKKILLIDTVNNILGEVDGVPDRNAFVLLGTPAELIRQMSELIQTLEKKARDEENSRCVEIMKDLFAENFHYRLMCGEIKDPTGKIDVHKAFVEYQELEPERMKFARYIEQRLAQLEKGSE